MARRSQASGTAEMSKADAIRDAIARLGRRARPRDVIADLSEKGVTVTSPQVSALMKKLGIKRRRRRGGRAAGEVTTTTATATRGAKRGPRASGGLTAGDLLDAKRLADQLGGVEKLKKALDVLEQLK
jgi:arginine repressor